MLQPSEILTGLTAIANDWRWLAITWHVYLVALLVWLLTPWRPSARLLSRLLIAPIASVGLVAWLSGNPFNGITFAVLGAALLWATARVSHAPVQPAERASVAAGIAIITFGWSYPHFLRTDGWIAYLYASPFGLLPCPTLSVAIGVTLAVRNLRVSSWSATLVIAGLTYGAIGTLRLGVVLDWVLVFASALLAAIAIALPRHSGRQQTIAEPARQ